MWIIIMLIIQFSIIKFWDKPIHLIILLYQLVIFEIPIIYLRIEILPRKKLISKLL